jgi:hypothetical protein
MPKSSSLIKEINMTCADHLRLDNTLADIKEITTVTQSWAHGFDTVAVNLTCCENKPRYAYFTMKLDGGWDKGFEKAIESFTDELRRYQKALSYHELKQDILLRSLIKRLEEIKVTDYDYQAAEKARLEEVHKFGHSSFRF